MNSVVVRICSNGFRGSLYATFPLDVAHSTKLLWRRFTEGGLHSSMRRIVEATPVSLSRPYASSISITDGLRPYDSVNRTMDRSETTEKANLSAHVFLPVVDVVILRGIGNSIS